MIEFFKTLYQQCDVGNIELRALPSRKQVFITLDDTPEIKTFCNTYQKDNLFFGIALRNGEGGTKKDLTQIPCVWCDADYKDISREALAGRLKNFPFTPSSIVKSGGGVHFYWLFKEPAGNEDILQIEDINRRIAAHFGGDLNSCDASRILRIPGTVNHKYDHKPVCEIAQTNQEFYNLSDFTDILPAPVKQAVVQSNRVTDTTSTWLSKAMQGTSEGSRNATAAKIAGHWINKLSAQDTLTILKTWNMQNNPSLPESEIETIVKSVSRYEPDKKENRVDISHVYTPGRMLEEYRGYISTLKQNRFITGVTEIDKRIRGVAGGEVMTIIARAGSFKTAMLQNLLRNYIKNSSWGAVFFSIEMPIPSVTERYYQIATGKTGGEIEQLYTSHDKEWLKDYEEGFSDELKNLFVVPQRVSISDMVDYVRLIEQEHNVKVGVIGVDYLGLIDGKGINEYEIISKLSRDTKSMAKMINLPVVMLGQVSRKGGDGEQEISLDMGRGSGAIEEGADFVLGLWQAEKESILGTTAVPEYDLICRILKNRKGSKGSRWRLELDPANFQLGAGATEYDPPKKQTRSFNM